MKNKIPIPHKHAELIKKWADDTSLKIQFKNSMGDWIISETPLWDKESQYRIKPEVIRYRVALCGNHVMTTSNEQGANNIENNFYFKKWITDWIEVEI